MSTSGSPDSSGYSRNKMRCQCGLSRTLTILLRVARFDAFDTNAEAQPPDGEFAQIK